MASGDETNYGKLHKGFEEMRNARVQSTGGEPATTPPVREENDQPGTGHGAELPAVCAEPSAEEAAERQEGTVDSPPGDVPEVPGVLSEDSPRPVKEQPRPLVFAVKLDGNGNERHVLEPGDSPPPLTHLPNLHKGVPECDGESSFVSPLPIPEETQKETASVQAPAINWSAVEAEASGSPCVIQIRGDHVSLLPPGNSLSGASSPDEANGSEEQPPFFDEEPQWSMLPSNGKPAKQSLWAWLSSWFAWLISHDDSRCPKELSKYHSIFGEISAECKDDVVRALFFQFCDTLPSSHRAVLYRKGGTRGCNAFCYKLARYAAGYERVWWQRWLGLNKPSQEGIKQRLADVLR